LKPTKKLSHLKLISKPAPDTLLPNAIFNVAQTGAEIGEAKVKSLFRRFAKNCHSAVASASGMRYITQL